jgi:hypothetical protein
MKRKRLSKLLWKQFYKAGPTRKIPWILRKEPFLRTTSLFFTVPKGMACLSGDTQETIIGSTSIRMESLGLVTNCGVGQSLTGKNTVF